MIVLPRPQFIEAIKLSCRNDNQQNTLLFAEINHATQVISLIQGLEAEESLIKSVEKFIVNSVSQYRGSQIGRIESNRFGIILPLSVEDSLDLAHHLTRKLDQQPLTVNGSTHYPKLIIGVTPLAPATTLPELAIAAADEALYQARRATN
jgi:GGDEF domain-containing protein